MVTCSLNKHLLRSCLYKWCPSCIGPIRGRFLLYIQREIELCSMVYSELIPNALLNDRSSSKREANIINNYSQTVKLILLNNNINNIQQYILTEPEVNNCFRIFTRSDLNRIKKETIKKRLV